MVQFSKVPKGLKPPSVFPHNLTLAVRFYRAMFVNPNLNILAAMDQQLATSLHAQPAFWLEIDRQYRKNPRTEVQALVKEELKKILEAKNLGQ